MTVSPRNETCAGAECSEPTPGDMPCIIFDRENDRAFCSPECARDALDDREDAPEMVELHDPQYAVDRGDLHGVSEDSAVIAREVAGVGDAIVAIGECADMYPGEFRSSTEPPE